MEVDSNSLDSPILKLGANEWSSIVAFVGPNDVLRLLYCGNPAIFHAMTGVSHVNLIWRCGRYIDYSEVFTTLRLFKSPYSIDFSISSEQLPYWTPIDWSQLPTSLTSLKMVATDAPSLLMSSGNLIELLPHLIDLDLSESTLLTRQQEHRPSLDFRNLPASLLKLRLKSPAIHYIVLAQLEHLPPSLLTFDLEISPHARSQQEADDSISPALGPVRTIRLPQLPDSITRLSLRDEIGSSAWQIDGSILPSSISFFSFIGFNFPRFEVEMPSKAGSVLAWNIHKHGHRFLNLKTLIIPTLVVIMSDAIEHFPPSITVLDASFKSGAIRMDPNFQGDPVDTLIKTFGPKLINYRQDGWDDLFYKTIMSGSLETPKLESITCFPLYSDTIVLPKGIKHYHGSMSRLEVNPEIESIEFYFSSTAPLYVWNFGSTLRSLTINTTMLSEHILALPRTLERLSLMLKKSDIWRLLASLICPQGQLPNLKQLILHESQIDADTLSLIPRSLETLVFGIEPNSLEPFASTAPLPQLFSNIKDSLIQTLNITIKGSTFSQTPFTIALLNHLPKGLKRFTLETQCAPSRYWPVTLPASLTALTIRLWKDCQAPETIDIEDPLLCLFKLPPTLESIICSGMDSLVPIEFFPPYLSKLSIQTNQGVHLDFRDYFASRTPPAHLQNPKLVY